MIILIEDVVNRKQRVMEERGITTNGEKEARGRDKNTAVSFSLKGSLKPNFLALANYNFQVRSLATSDYEGGLPLPCM